MLPSTIQFGLHVPRTSTRFFVRFLLSMKLLPNWVILPKGSFVFYLVFKESKLCVRTSQDFSWQIFHGANNFENYETVGSQQNRNCINVACIAKKAAKIYFAYFQTDKSDKSLLFHDCLHIVKANPLALYVCLRI